MSEKDKIQEAINFHKKGYLDKAEKIYLTLLDNKKLNFDIFKFLSVLNYQKKNYNKAIQYIDLAINIKPENSEIWSDKGVYLKQIKNINEAIKCFDKSVVLNNKNINALINRGNIFLSIKDFKQALNDFDSCIKIDENHIEALNGKGVALLNLNKDDEAIIIFQKCLSINKNFLQAKLNLGNLYLKKNNFLISEKIFNDLLNEFPNNAVLLNNLGVLYLKNNNFKKSLFFFNKMLEKNQEDENANINKAIIYFKLKKYNESLECLNLVLSNNKNNFEAIFNRAQNFVELKKFDKAIEDFSLAYKFDETFSDLIGSYLYCKLKIFDMNGFDELKAKIKDSVTNNLLACVPHFFIHIFDDPELEQKLCKKFSENFDIDLPHNEIRIEKNISKEKLKIGFFSNCLKTHALGFLMLNLFEKINKEKFELHGFIWDEHNKEDKYFKRIQKNFSTLSDLSFISDAEAIKIAKEKKLDIAIDLVGYAKSHRTNIFSNRCAKKQVNFLHYPGSMSVKFVDYIIADNFLITKDLRKNYLEKIVFMPKCYQPNSFDRFQNLNLKNRNDFGFAQNDFIFCCHNNSIKINKDVLDTWIEILLNTENTVIWLLEDNLKWKKNIINYFISKKIDPNRIYFSPRTNNSEYLSRLKVADLFLDTFPCNAHTTASDCVMMELPILTISGKSFASRVCGSILNSINLNELITFNKDNYISKAIELSQDKNQYNYIKTIIKSAKKTYIHLSGDQYVFDFEKAMKKICSSNHDIYL